MAEPSSDTDSEKEYDELAPWNGFDFGYNIEYAENYMIEGDPGDGLLSWEAAKVLADSALNESYDMQTTLLITLVDLQIVHGEECYVFEVTVPDNADFAPSLYAVGYQGNVYTIGDIRSSNGSLDLDEDNYFGSSWEGVYLGDGFSVEITNSDSEGFWFEIFLLRNGSTIMAGSATYYPDNSFMAEYGDISLSLYEDFSAIDLFVSESSEWAHLRGQYLRV